MSFGQTSGQCKSKWPLSERGYEPLLLVGAPTFCFSFCFPLFYSRQFQSRSVCAAQVTTAHRWKFTHALFTHKKQTLAVNRWNQRAYGGEKKKETTTGATQRKLSQGPAVSQSHVNDLPGSLVGWLIAPL